MIGEKTLGAKIAKRLDGYAEALATKARSMIAASAPVATPAPPPAPAPLPLAESSRMLIVADVLRLVAIVIREVTQ